MIRWLVIAMLVMLTPAAAQRMLGEIECVEMDTDTKVKVRTILLDALDQAFKDHVIHMYAVWMKDEGIDARLRARNGTRIGIKAYASVRELIIAQKWSCK
jgi:hypothetical protein